MDRETRRRFEAWRAEAPDPHNTVVDDLFAGECDRAGFIQRATMFGLSVPVDVGCARSPRARLLPRSRRRRRQGRRPDPRRPDADPKGTLEPWTYQETAALQMGGIKAWLPIIFMGALVIGVFALMRFMPRTRPAQIKSESAPSIAWSDIAGADEAKEELREVVDYLRDPQKFRDIGAKVPKGILLHGPPGTGKTLLAKAVAHESGATFFSQSAASFVEMFVGVGAARIRHLFKAARKKAPGDRVHRRARRGGRPPRVRRLRRARPDAEPAPGRAGRVRRRGRRWW